MTFDVPLQDTSSAGLGITLKGKTIPIIDGMIDALECCEWYSHGWGSLSNASLLIETLLSEG
jgi:hypothetical protein